MAKFNPSKDINSPMDTDSYPKGSHTNAEEVEELLYGAPPSDFIDSLHDWWEEKGFLTEDQFNKLSEIAERG